MFSYQPAEQSSGVSVSVYDIFIELTGMDFISHGAFRKIAHFCEFAALGFSVCGASCFYKNQIAMLVPMLICFVYSVSDELHQLFVPERAGRLFDIFVDSCGSFFGICVFALLFYAFNRMKKVD